MTNSTQLLTRTECSVLRGLAIIGIVMHNFCHWLGPIVKENEYQWFKGNVDGLTRVIVSPDINLPVHLLSFFGHYGVPVFLFLSAYGLVCKYESGTSEAGTQERVGRWQFIRYHFLKLFKMMTVGFVAFTMLDQITPGAHRYELPDVIAQMGMVNNLLPTPDKIIWPGPYWFFGLMLQLYILYRLLFYRRGWQWIVGAIIVCWIAQMFCSPEGEVLNRLRYNCIGGILPFGLGLLYARYGRALTTPRYALLAIISAVAVFVLGYSYQTWFWVPLFVCTFCIGFVKWLSACSPLAFLMNHLDWVGSISATLFVIHPLTRKIFIGIARDGRIYAGLLLYVIASICLAWCVKKYKK